MSIKTQIDRLAAAKAAIVAAIKGKGVSVPAAALLDDLDGYVEQIETGADVSGVTAAAADVAAGKKFVNSAGVLTDGTMPSVTQATPSITVSSAGLITASATQAAGKVAAGTKSATKQLTTQGAKTVTPTASEQVAVPAGVFTTGAVKVAGVSYDERAELRAQMLGIQASDLYALYSTSAKVGSATLKAHVEAWLADSVYNNPTAYPNSAYEQAVNSAFEALDAYAATAGTAGTESIVTGTVYNSSYKVKTISGLTFKKIKAFYIGVQYQLTTNSSTTVTGYLFFDGDAYVRVSAYNNNASTELITGGGHTYTYSNGTLTVNLYDQYMSGSYLVYAVIGEV